MGTPAKRTTLPETPKQKDEGSLEEKEYTPLQTHFLSSLKSLKVRRAEYLEDPNKEERLLRLLDKGLYSAYRDCADSGVEEEAKAVLSGDRTDS